MFVSFCYFSCFLCCCLGASDYVSFLFCSRVNLDFNILTPFHFFVLFNDVKGRHTAQLWMFLQVYMLFEFLTQIMNWKSVNEQWIHKSIRLTRTSSYRSYLSTKIKTSLFYSCFVLPSYCTYTFVVYTHMIPYYYDTLWLALLCKQKCLICLGMILFVFCLLVDFFCLVYVCS